MPTGAQAAVNWLDLLCLDVELNGVKAPPLKSEAPPRTPQLEPLALVAHLAKLRRQ